MPNQTKSKNDNSKGIKKASTTPKKEKSTKDTKVSKASKASKTSKVKDNLQDSVESIISEPKETTICKKDKNVQKDKKIKAEDTKDEELTKDDYYTIIDSIIKQNNNKEFINHQLSSYKQFIVKDIGDIIKQFNTRKIYFNYDQKANKHKTELHIDFLNYNIGGPTIHENDGSYQQMTPQMARLRNLTYRAPLNINLKLTRIVRSRNENKSAYNLDIEDVKERYFNNIKFGQIPIMVRSHNCILNKKDGLNNVQKGECKYDYGGYFIISGNEKVIVSQERMAEGEPFVFSNQRKQKCIEIEIRCVSDDHFSVVMNNLIRLKYDNNSLEFESPSFKHPIPIFLLFKAMDIKNDKDMIQTIIWELGSGTKNETKFLKIIKDGFIAFNNNPTFKLGNDTRKYQELVITYLNFKGGNKEIKLTMDDKIAYLKKIFIDEVLPHVGSSFSKKCKYMGMMIRKLLLVHLGELPFDDRDSYQNKRVDTPGRLLASLFRQCFNKLVKDIVKNLTKEIKNNKGSKDIFEIITNDNMYRIVKPNIIEGGLKYALATGNWGVKTNGKGSAKVGTAQVLNRLNYQSYLSHLRRINSPNDKKNNNGKIIKPRKLHGTVWGYICPIETPEGQPVGLVKNMAMSTKISYSCNSTLVKEMITKLGMISINKSKYSDYYKHTLVLVNGNWIGIHKEPEKFIKELREARRNGLINIYTGIYWDYTSNQIKIYTDAGRLLRPLFIVRDDAINLTKQDIRHLKMLNNNFNYLLTPNNFLHELKINSLFKNINHGISLNEGDNKKIMSQINENIEELKILKENGNNFNSIIEYIDTNETNNCLISISPDELKNKNLDPKYVEIAQYNNGFTHCEIDPSIIQGVVASVIPFPDRNQSPRNTYQCLKYDTPVLMANGTHKLICDIKVGDSVVTFDPNTFEQSYSKVINQYVKNTEKQMYKIKLIGDNEIIATFDHKFMTNNGWKTVDSIDIDNDKLLTKELPIFDQNNTNSDIILSVDDYINKFKNYGIESIINIHKNKLIQLGLLPFKYDNDNINLIAKIIGYLTADGSAGIYNNRKNNKRAIIQADFGSECSAKMFNDDIYYIIGKKNKYIEREGIVNGVKHHTFHVSYTNEISTLLIALGIDLNKKTTKPSNGVPSWIQNSNNKYLISNYLSGLFGGDGCKIRFNKMNKCGYNYICASMQMTKINKYIDSLKKFMTQLSTLLNKFNIESSVKTINSKDEGKQCSGVKLKDTQENLIKFMENISYAYDNRKLNESLIVYNFLKYHNNKKVNHINTIKNIRNDIDNLERSEICKKYNINRSNLSAIIRSKNNNRKISCPNIKTDNVSSMYKRFDSSKDKLFSPIKSIEKCDNYKIADITTESENHSFIANGFCVHNSAMCKQAMGVYITNYQERMDTVAYVLDTVERPLVRTRYGSTVNYSNLPCGLNAMVAICCYTGYNQEDSVLLNQNAVDRGLFRATFYRTYKDDEKKIQSNGKEEKFGKPDPKYTQNMKPANYGKLNENGFAEKNEFVTSKDIIIGKVLPLKNKSENGHPLYKDCSTNLKPNESGFIDKIYTSRNADGFRFIKTKIRSIRIPSIGDKFSSRCGQKGTVGILYNQEDMPYSEEGLCPDIIMNSHAIPSRMTIGQIMECLMGKASADLGGFSDCTPFTDLTEEQVGNILLANGFDYTGNETLYSGITGQQMNVKIFMGPTYYQRLKHMVIDKIHSRDSGPVVQLTRQPAEGRSRDGGLRMGEMERDCFVYNTPVTLNSFSSIMIQDLEKQDKYVLGWDKKKNGMVKSKQTHFLCKGERKCVDLTFNDGRVVSCTPEHKVLTSENKWVKVKDLKVGTDKVKTAIRYPLINIKNEMKLCKDWSLNAGSLKLNCKTEKDYLKSLAFARIIGYLTTDGHIKNDENSGSICLGHMIDVEGLIDDLKYFQKNLQKNYKVKNKNFYTVYLQTNFIKNVAKLKGIATGNKYDQDIELPEFILDKKCPLPIIREYLGGLFGGDGHTCVLGLHRGKRDTLTSISFSKSRMPKHLKSLEKTIKKLQYLLKKFGIKKTTIQKKKETSHSKNRHKNNELLTDESRSYQITLHLDIDELITFHEKIGFRYCCHKTQRLEAGVAYKRLRDAVVRQRLWIIKRVDELCNYTKIKEQNPNQVIKTKKYVDKAIEELEKKEALIHKYAIPTKHAIGDYLIKKRSVDKFNYKSFPTAEKFMRDIGAYNWFINDEETDDKTDNKTKTQEKIKEETEEKTKDDTKEETKEETKIETKDKKEDKNKKSSTCYGVCRDAKALPTMDLTLIDRRDGGTHKVYDIQVEDTHSFAANGIVSHNCMIAHGALGFLKERLMDVSDLFSINICRSCGSIAVVNDDEDNEIYECRMCDKYVDFATIDMPYACKLLMQELQGMMVTPKFILN